MTQILVVGKDPMVLRVLETILGRAADLAFLIFMEAVRQAIDQPAPAAEVPG